VDQDSNPPGEGAAVNGSGDARKDEARRGTESASAKQRNEQRLHVLARIDAMSETLRHRGSDAFRSAFAEFSRAELTAHATVTAALLDLLERLLATDERETASDVLVWLLQQEELPIPPGRLRRIARLIVEHGHHRHVTDRIASLPSASAHAKLCLGLTKIAHGAQVAGAELCRQALAGPLSAGLREIANREVAAAQFHRLGGSLPGNEDRALVLIEPDANTDLVHLVLERTAFVEVCASAFFSAEALLSPRGARHRHVTAVKFRLADIPEIAPVIRAFSDRFVHLALNHVPMLQPLASRGDEYAAALEAIMRIAIYNPMRWLFNAMEAIDKSNAERIFFITKDGSPSFALAAHLLGAKGRHEVWMGSGARSPQSRDTFAKAASSTDPLRALREVNTHEAPVPDQIENLPLNDASLFVDLAPQPPRRPGKKHCIVCATAPNGRMPFPLRAVLEPLLQDWDPVLVIAMDRKHAAAISEKLPQLLGDLLPKVAVKQLSWHAAFERLLPEATLAGTLSQLLSDGELSAIAFRGINLASALQAYCLRFLRQLACAARLVEVFDKTIAAWSPDFVLTQQAYLLDTQLLQLSARHVDVPTFGLQIFLYGRDDRHSAPVADRFLCFDRFARDVLHEMTGYPLERLSVIGSVRYDASLRDARSRDRAEERRAVEIAENQQLVVAATQPLSLEHNERLVDITLEALSEIPDARLIIKLHPREPDARIAVFERQAEMRGLTDRVRVTKHHDTYRLLAAADLVVNMVSNVGLEAAILDRNVVSVEIGLEMDIFSLDGVGLVEAARTREDAIAKIRSLLLDPQARLAAESKRRAFFRENPELQDGRSLERLLQAIRASLPTGAGLAAQH
jgi:hypothetical protein